MKFFSIISEFNPFHTGHRYLIEQTKAKTGTDAIVCIMSGSMVQRGDVAIYDKWVRAKAAVENGADLVIELPVCYVLQSAEIFARGSVELADMLGSQGIAFGSECTDPKLLWDMARLRAEENDLYKNTIKDMMNRGMGYPRACLEAAKAVLGDLPKEAAAPNATLAVAYMSAILKINPSLKTHIEKRIGEYHDTSAEGEFASATAIRQKILKGDKTCQFSLCTSDDIYDINNISPFILGFLRSADPFKLSAIAGMEDGLAQRLVECSKQSTSLDELTRLCVTKRYTLHRIRRVILCSILGITDAPSPSYARVLALNSTGAKILKEAKNRDNLEIISKVADASPKCAEMLRHDILATDISALCASKKASMDYTNSPIVV
ncbi:MAG: nucleotidyltransferase family protein [Clostridia bacterium]|nr:nucleotidyltransferase family protein [Clostridia bacterium]